jgi:hypothetical protein
MALKLRHRFSGPRLRSVTALAGRSGVSSAGVSALVPIRFLQAEPVSLFG